jgi:NAD+ kinase
MSQPIKKLAIAYNPEIPEAEKLSGRIEAFMRKLGATVQTVSDINGKALRQQVKKNEFEAMIVLGGDGTMLRANHLCASADLPIIGINLGSFGFLMELQRDEWEEYLPRLLSGDYRIEKRMLLQAEHFRKDTSRGSWLVVNDVVVCRGQHVRPIRLDAAVDGHPMASYVADGLIAATPTGSTAYALAAGGAILPPDLRNIIVVPVAPHLSPDQSIILNEGAHISIHVRTSHQAVFSVDGHDPVIMEDDDFVMVGASKLDSHYIRFRDAGYFYRTLNRFMEQNPTLNHLR